MNELLTAAAENVQFLLVCLLIAAGIVLLAVGVEKLLYGRFHTKKSISRTKYVALVGMFSAIAAVLMYLEIPLPFAPSFYKIDFSDIPVMICAFILGPVGGVICEFVKVLLKLVLKGTTTAFVGDFANFVVGCTLVLPASIVYHIKKSKSTAAIGMMVGTFCMTVFGSLFNAVYLLPRFSALYGMPLESIIAMGTAVNANVNSITTLVLWCVVPFNLLKGLLVLIITMILYKRLVRLLHVD